LVGAERHFKGHVDDWGMAFGEFAGLPSNQVDVFRDLGMSEEAITRYLWRWQFAAELSDLH
jgi:hypothetical protein